jgi:hypothetical protein
LKSPSPIWIWSFSIVVTIPRNWLVSSSTTDSYSLSLKVSDGGLTIPEFTIDGGHDHFSPFPSWPIAVHIRSLSLLNCQFRKHFLLRHYRSPLSIQRFTILSWESFLQMIKEKGMMISNKDSLFFVPSSLLLSTPTYQSRSEFRMIRHCST